MKNALSVWFSHFLLAFWSINTENEAFWGSSEITSTYETAQKLQLYARQRKSRSLHMKWAIIAMNGCKCNHNSLMFMMEWSAVCDAIDVDCWCTSHFTPNPSQGRSTLIFTAHAFPNATNIVSLLMKNQRLRKFDIDEDWRLNIKNI